MRKQLLILLLVSLGSFYTANALASTILSLSPTFVPVGERATISLNLNENDGEGGVTTQHTHNQNSVNVVIQTPPSTANGTFFQKWQRNGLYLSSGGASMDSDNLLTALYKTGTITDTLASGLSIASKFMMDSEAIYWAEDDNTVPFYQDATTGLVRKVSKSGGPIITLASGLNHPTAVLLDDVYV